MIMVECGTRSENVKKIHIGLVCILCFLALLLGIHTIQKMTHEHSYQLQDVRVTTTDDSDVVGAVSVTDEQDRWISVIPTVMTYELTFKPLDDNKYYQFDEGAISASIEPSEYLRNQSKLKAGSNFYDGMYGSDIEVHMTSSHQLKVKLNYTVGANKQNEVIPLPPSAQTLSNLEKIARDGSVTLMRHQDKIGRFSLKTLQREKEGLF
jgi:hypothetical protein